MPAGYSFRPRIWAFALAAAGCAAFIALGNWQARRAEEKRALGAQSETKRMSIAGEFLPRFTVLLDNKLRKGRPGYEVLTPLRLADSKLHVLVNRGWVAAAATRAVLPEVRTPAGQVRIEGIAQARLAQAMQLEDRGVHGPVRQNLELAAYAAETGLALQPFVLEQHAGPDDGLARDWARPDAGVDKHEAYALQWYSLAALAVVLVLVLSFHRVEPA
jgi:surfeit locus 1 family protein